MDERNLIRKVAELSNMGIMVMLVLMAFIALSVGFAFFFLVAGPVGYGIGVTMFVVAALLFVVGEVNYFVKKRRLTEQY